MSQNIGREQYNDKNKKFSHLTITIIDFSYNRSSLSKNVFKNKEYTKS